MIIIMITGLLLMLIGFWGMMTRKNMIRIVLGLAIAEVGLQLVMISAGYVKEGTAPIFSDGAVEGSVFVDPVPQALVLTAIVIGVAVNALILGLVIKMYRHRRSLDVNDYMESE